VYHILDDGRHFFGQVQGTKGAGSDVKLRKTSTGTTLKIRLKFTGG
jgi:hypothetical protein